MFLYQLSIYAHLILCFQEYADVSDNERDQPLNIVFTEEESPKKERKRCVFLDDEANDSSDEEEDEEGDTGLEGFIDHR